MRDDMNKLAKRCQLCISRLRLFFISCGQQTIILFCVQCVWIGRVVRITVHLRIPRMITASKELSVTYVCQRVMQITGSAHFIKRK